MFRVTHSEVVQSLPWSCSPVRLSHVWIFLASPSSVLFLQIGGYGVSLFFIRSEIICPLFSHPLLLFFFILPVDLPAFYVHSQSFILFPIYIFFYHKYQEHDCGFGEHRSLRQLTQKTLFIESRSMWCAVFQYIIRGKASAMSWNSISPSPCKSKVLRTLV